MLSSYFYSKNGDFNFDLLKNIQQFPTKQIFKEMEVDISDNYEVAKNYIRAQENIKKNNQLSFLKTHSSFCKLYNKFNFSNLQNSLGVIYIVRDPRNVITSFANHNSQSKDQILKLMTNNYTTGNDKNELEVYVGSWNFNYNSWKVFKNSNRYHLVKYEDLVANPKDTFNNILLFIRNITLNNFFIDPKKIEKVVDQTNFSKIKNMEKKKGFIESKINDVTGKKVAFFNLGPKNNWKNILEKNIIDEIETKFQDEMKELGYL